MINDNTILSSFNDRPTLLEWLKKVEEALKSDTATAFHVNNRGNATLTFSIDFANGTSLESEPIVLQKGESVIGAEIRSGHLILTLSNGDELDAGDVKPVNSFLINDSQHLIVNFDDGTNQDLGAIFTGNVNIDGNFTANSIIENMNGYSIEAPTINTGRTTTPIYCGICKNGNKLTCVFFFKFSKSIASPGGNVIFNVIIPSEVGAKLYPFSLGGFSNLLDYKEVLFFKNANSTEKIFARMEKVSNTRFTVGFDINNLVSTDTDYIARYECTFLLSDNLTSN